MSNLKPDNAMPENEPHTGHSYFKKIVLALISAFLVVSMGQTALSETVSLKHRTPIIIVHGMAGSILYHYPNTSKEKKMAASGLGNVFGTLVSYPSFVSYVVKMMASDEPSIDREAAFKKLESYAKSTTMNCDANGDSDPDVGINNYWTDPLSNHPEYFDRSNTGVVKIARQICTDYGATNVYAYNYDWRLDLNESGKGLNTFIQSIKSETGSDKVILVTDSLGGSTVNCYLDQYKQKQDLKRVIFINSAFEGVDCASAFANGLSMDQDLERKYLDRLGSALKGGQFEMLFLYAASLFGGSLDHLCKNINGTEANPQTLNRVFNDVFKPILGNVPAIWECIPYDDFDAAVEHMSDIGYLDKSTGLYKKLVRYHAAQGRCGSNLKYLKDHGVDVAVICSYGFPGLPITEKCYKQTDILIETEHASAGATVAYSGQKLQSYKGKKHYFSPDREIDASTCALPDNTWFLKNIRHLGYIPGKGADQFLSALAVGKIGCDLSAVKQETGLGQFLRSDSNQDLHNITEAD